jgi:hypothetical protein
MGELLAIDMLTLTLRWGVREHPFTTAANRGAAG